MTTVDYLVIGGGIAGVSVAAELARFASVRVLEREAHLGYHSTGRSAAHFQESYGNDVVRRLTRATGPFLRHPPPGFADHPLLQPRPTLLVAREDQAESLEVQLRVLEKDGLSVEVLSGVAARLLAPMLRPGHVRAALHDPTAADIDVESLLRGYARVCKARGGEILQGITIHSLARNGSQWRVDTSHGLHETRVLVNAAGAWADEVATAAGIRPLGLSPKRRTAFTFPSNPHGDVAALPLVIDIDEQFYFKADAGNIMASPADETACLPCDAMPEDWDIAVAVDRIQKATDLAIPRILRRWAGLRTFAADRVPVVGYDAPDAGFFWVAGQGGYGMQTSDAMARAAAALAAHRTWPSDLRDLGLTPESLQPARLRGTAPHGMPSV